MMLVHACNTNAIITMNINEMPPSGHHLVIGAGVRLNFASFERSARRRQCS